MINVGTCYVTFSEISSWYIGEDIPRGKIAGGTIMTVVGDDPYDEISFSAVLLSDGSIRAVSDDNLSNKCDIVWSP